MNQLTLQPKLKGNPKPLVLDNKKQNIMETLQINPEVLKLIPGFDANMIRMGFYSAKYFIRTNEVMKDLEDNDQIITMQVFQKTSNALIAGVELVENLIKLCAGEYKDSEIAKTLFNEYINLKGQENQARQLGDLKNARNLYDKMVYIQNELEVLWHPARDLDILTLHKDGDIVDRYKPIIKIRGPYKYFAKLESVYLGLLARATKVATNTNEVVKAANGKPVIFFADRFDGFGNQQLDGYAALMGGVAGVATDAQGYFNKIPGIGTTPHALIAAHNGDTAEATYRFAKRFPEVPLIALVDFDNICANTSLGTAKYLKTKGIKLDGVRLDTSGTIVDEGVLFQDHILEDNIRKDVIKGNNRLPIDETEKRIKLTAEKIRQTYLANKETNNVVNNSLFPDEMLEYLNKIGLTGVNKNLVHYVREQLDQNGFQNVKIYVSGGFNREKIADFEANKVPVDGYGVGSSLLTSKYMKSNGDFTADIVRFNGKNVAKIGRKEF